MKQLARGICALLLATTSFYASAQDNAHRCRTGVVESVERHNGSEPANMKKVFPEIVRGDDDCFLRVQLLLDAGRKISNYDYALKSQDGSEKYKCVAISDAMKFDSENWQIGPFEENRRVSMIFTVPTRRVESREDFLLCFDLPVGYDVPDLRISMGEGSKDRSKPAVKQVAANAPGPEASAKQAKAPTVNAGQLSSAPEKADEKEGSSAPEGAGGDLAENFPAKIEKISVNPKSFTFYVKKEDGSVVKLCLYGIIPAEDEKLHSAVGKALNTKYSGMDVSVKGTGTDRYGRILAKVYTGEDYLNKRMIVDGFAFYSFRYAPNDPELQDAIK